MTVECPCGNDQERHFIYYGPLGVLGVFCRRCNREFLSVDATNPDPNSTEDELEVSPLRVYKSRDISRYDLHENTALQVHGSRRRIYDIRKLDVGDQIAFHRPYVIWHHCIVTAVHASDNTLQVINWQTENGRLGVRVREQQIDVAKEHGYLYKIEYNSAIQLSNPPHLVIARARSRLTETCFHIFNDNCESFATFCKTGICKSYQCIWLLGKIEEWLAHFTVMIVSRAVTVFDVLARVVTRFVGPVVVIVLEGLLLALDVAKAYRERRNGRLSRNEYARIAIRRIVDGVVTVTFTLIGVLVVASILSTGPIATCLVGSTCVGIVGMTVGKIGGTFLGTWIGRAITKYFKTDDRAVDTITDLVPGDHVVMSMWALHPRCHGILVEHDSHSKIRVIRNTHKYGVVDEWLPFEKPLYLVTHKKKECFPNEEVLRRAKGQLGATRYNIASHNCKTFATWCKRRN